MIGKIIAVLGILSTLLSFISFFQVDKGNKNYKIIAFIIAVIISVVGYKITLEETIDEKFLSLENQYRNDEYGFQFNYPTAWKTESNIDPIGDLIICLRAETGVVISEEPYEEWSYYLQNETKPVEINGHIFYKAIYYDNPAYNEYYICKLKGSKIILIDFFAKTNKKNKVSSEFKQIMNTFITYNQPIE